MDHHTPIATHPSDKTRSTSVWGQELQHDDCDHLPMRNRAQGWRLILAILALMGLLLVLHYVVRGALQHNELRQEAEALHARALWRCNKLQDHVVNGICLARVNAQARKMALLQSRTPTDAPQGNP
ncbi:MAG: hypothetical protein ABL896_16405 [Hylemonella sp.]